jgi:enamine deaminase RidA (YjgF/YER057c/UK114 family)
MAKPEVRIQELGLTLPKPHPPFGTYRTSVLVGNLLFLSGHSAPADAPKELAVGRVGVDLNLDQASKAAREVGRDVLATVRDALGSLDKVKRLVRTLGMINAAPDFKDHAKVMNGFSELMAEVFGPDAGLGVRCSVGMGSLPGNVPVEVECLFEVMI